MEPIFEGFFDAADVLRQFEDPEGLDGAELLVAVCDGYAYEESACIVFRRDGRLYEVYGSHCSCHGFEGQWDPEETTLEALEKADSGPRATAYQLLKDRL